MKQMQELFLQPMPFLPWKTEFCAIKTQVLNHKCDDKNMARDKVR